MTSKGLPSVTVMICVAGCSSTTTQDMPYSQHLPPPDFNKKSHAEQRIASRPIPPQRPAPKPITVDVPIAVLEGPPPRLATTFEPVSDEYLRGGPRSAPKASREAFFTPLEDLPVSALSVPVIAPAPIKTAEALLKPLVAPAPHEVAAEPIAYAQYVSVGPEYFGLDAEIAPYVISRSDTPIPPRREYAEAEATVMRSEREVSESDRHGVVATAGFPQPRNRPARPAPNKPRIPSPAPEIAALVPPRPDPEPRHVPVEHTPGLPTRTLPDRLVPPGLRDEPVDETATGWSARLDKPSRKTSGWSTAVERALAEPKSGADTAPKAPTYRVRVDPANRPPTAIASLSPTPSVDSSPLPDIGLSPLEVKPIEPASAGLTSTVPVPRIHPNRSRPNVTLGQTSAGVSREPDNESARPPANDAGTTADCQVHRGSNERMILVCKGVNVSQAQVFRAVVEGESAYRGLRAFDESDAIVERFGFNADRFTAMSQGPRSARDLAFLRALRKSGTQIRIKGRPFDMYLMKGDKSLATVLIEQIAASEAPAAVRRH